jgi:hypothetical protein
MLLTAVVILSSHLTVFAVNAPDRVNEWRETAITYPAAGQLVPAGEITVEWQALDPSAMYELYLDGESAAMTNLLSLNFYITEVRAHTIAIVTEIDGRKVFTGQRTFYVSKKGIGSDIVANLPNMNLSWYYNWNHDQPQNTPLEYVPQFWNGVGTEKMNTAEFTDKYSQILGFNEPDLQQESNISPQEAADLWKKYFIPNRNKIRIGSPVMCHSWLYDDATNTYSDTWLSQFMDLVDNQVDFIVLHTYCDDWGTGANPDQGKAFADAFLLQIDKIYEKYQKPIWITEYGLRHQSIAPGQPGDSDEYRANVVEAAKQIIQYTVEGFNKRRYVERFAWFPMNNPDWYDAWGSTLFTYDKENPQLKELGELYRDTGNPKGYDPDNPTPDVPIEGDRIDIEIDVFFLVDYKKKFGSQSSYAPNFKSLKEYLLCS